MKLVISQLEIGENRFSFSSEKESWMQALARSLGERGHALTSPLLANLALTKLEPDYYLKGEIGFSIEQTCARCAEPFSLKVKHPFEMALAHVTSTEARSPEIAEESDHLDVSFFEGPEIALSPILEEQFFLSLPYQSICSENCLGVCQHCGINRNESTCECEKNHTTSPFAILNKLKPNLHGG